MPFPRSSKVIFSPRRALAATTSTRAVPPPPWVNVFRASSLAAVTIFVWSTRLNPSSMASARTCCRTTTMSFAVRTGSRSFLRTDIGVPAIGEGPLFQTIGRVEQRAQQCHAALDVERRSNAGERKAELHEGNRHGGLHAGDHRVRVQDAGHGGDVGDHAPDERVHHLARRNVDEDPASAGGGGAGGGPAGGWRGGRACRRGAAPGEARTA